MAATPVFKFTTTTIASGHTLRIYSTSTDWYNYIETGDATTALLTITALDGDAIFTNGALSYTQTLVPLTDLAGDFHIDVTTYQMFGVDIIIPDDILTVNISITNTAQDNYTTNEVCYYNTWVTKSDICYNAVNQINEINSWEIKYACMVNMLYEGLHADIVAANTGGIYEKFDIFKRLAYDLGRD